MGNFDFSKVGGGGNTDWWVAIAPLAPMVATALIFINYLIPIL